MTTIAVDGLNEETFRRSIEARLRQGLTSEAIAKLRALIRPYAAPGGVLPERFITVKASDLTLNGWEQLGETIAQHDRPGHPVTALSIAFGWPGEELPQPDPEGRLAPLLETGFFSDESFPFSQSAREDLLDGYSYHGCTWSDDTVATTSCLTLDGIDDLHGALALLEARLLASDAPDEEEIRAGSLGACLLSALLFQAVALRIERDGLPRPLCVLSGSNGVYPYFDAPVVGMPPEALKAEEEDEELSQVPGPRYSSLLVTGIPRARKRAVLVLEESEAEKALRTADLRSLGQGEASPAPDQIAAQHSPPVPDFAESGITPAPHGPLVAKNPDKKAWDFRDLLSASDEVVSPEPIAEAEPKAGWPDPLPAIFDRAPLDLPTDPPAVEAPDLPPIASPEPTGQEPAEFPAPRLPRLPLGPPPEPGFALLDDDIQNRLQVLLTPSVPEQAPAPEPVVVEEEASLAPAASSGLAPPNEPVWPLGIGWLEDAEVDSAPEAPAEYEVHPGLWTRLRHWLTRRS